MQRISRGSAAKGAMSLLKVEQEKFSAYAVADAGTSIPVRFAKDSNFQDELFGCFGLRSKSA
jgi:hypothetical protein